MIATKPSTAKSSTRLALSGAFLTALLSLAGCSILPEREPISVYEPVFSAAAAHSEWPQANWSLLVSRPVASQQLDSERITVRPAPGALQVYKGAAWSDNAPDLVQSSLLRSFQDAQNILSVSAPAAVCAASSNFFRTCAPSNRSMHSRASRRR